MTKYLCLLLLLAPLAMSQSPRTDRNGLTFNPLSIKPPDIGCQTPVTIGTGIQGSDCAAINICTPGTSVDQVNLSQCGNLYGAGLQTTDPQFPGSIIARFTDFNDNTSCPGGAEIGPGGSAEESVFSHDDQLINLTCTGGNQEVFKVFNPTTLAPGNYCTNVVGGGLTIFSTAQGGFVEPPFDNVFGTETWYGGINESTLGSKVVFTVAQPNCTATTPVTVSDFSHVHPCFSSPSTCPNYPGTNTLVAGGTIILPLTNNADAHEYELLGQQSSGCTTGATQPNWAINQNYAGAGGNFIDYYVDGGCTWVDIQPGPNSATGHVTVDELYPWQDGSDIGGGLAWVSTSCPNNCAQGGVGSIHFVNFEPSTNTYTLWELATGNIFKTVCTPDYTCSGSAATSYVGNAIPPTGGLARFHNAKFRCTQAMKPCYMAMNQQICALTASPAGAPQPQSQILCASGLNSFMWKQGTTVVTFLGQAEASPGHKVEGFRGQLSTNGSINSNPNYWWEYNAYDPPTLARKLMVVGTGTPCSPACPATNPLDSHQSWNGVNSTDTFPTCAAVDSLQWWTVTFPYAWEIYCVATDGSNVVWRQGFEYTTANGVFNNWAGIGSMSSNRTFWGQTSSWWCTLGSAAGATNNLCALPWQPTTAYALGDQVSPGTGDNPDGGGICSTFGCVFQVTSCSGTCTSQASNAGRTSHPAWCGTSNCTVIDNAGANQIVWTNEIGTAGSSCQTHTGCPFSSVFIFKLLPMAAGGQTVSPPWIAKYTVSQLLVDAAEFAELTTP